MIKMKLNKKAIGVVVTLSLLLLVVIVSAFVLNDWFSSFQNDLYYKNIQSSQISQNSIKIYGIKFENSIPVLYIRNNVAKNFKISGIELSGEDCILDGGNAIFQNSMNKIYLNCPYSVINTELNINQIKLITQSDIYAASIKIIE